MRGKPAGLIFHSDQGTQYTAFEFRKHLRELGVKSSFSNPGTPLDNAVAESFFASMKREELSHKYYYDLEVLRHDVADYIDFFNNMRPHQKQGMLTPSAAEAKFSG
jgi:transposase InsO family protein